MKNIMRIGVAGALVAGFATAQAQVPSSGNSDLWLFVSDATAQTTFAEDLNKSITSIVGSTFVNNANLNTSISAHFTIGPSGALTSYINTANAAGHTLQWAVEAAQYPGFPNGNNTAGQTIAITANPSSQAGNTANMVFNSNVTTWASAFNTDATYMLATQAAGGSTYAWSAGDPTVAQVWRPGLIGNQFGSTDLYGQGPDTAGIAPGASLNLYALTGNGGNGQVQSYLLGTNLKMAADGTLSVGGAAVPLPAAVWLFGSGLLGLIGVGRRRTAAA